SLESRLREIMRERQERTAPPLIPSDDPAPSISIETPRLPDRRLDQAAATFDGDVLQTPSGACVVVDRFYPADHCHGLVRIGDIPGRALAAQDELSLIGGRPEPLDREPRPLLFVDLETTGLAGGAGTYAFLVGCAYFEPHGLRIRQYFLPGYQHERPLLHAVDDLVRQSAGLVSYNGKSFDVPVLETRFQFNRLAPPFEGLAHVDILHVARRFWRSTAPAPGGWPDTDSCRLIALERLLFGVRRVGDVGGLEIPGRYFDFMRTGNASPLLPVLEHNRLDLLSLAMMTARALRVLREAPQCCSSARESLAAGRLLDRAGRTGLAVSCFEDAIERARIERGGDAGIVRAEALHALALRLRRQGRYEEAATRWHTLIVERRSSPAVRREALDALAIHYEHRTRNLDEARRYAAVSLAERVGTSGMERGRHRVARLDRKLAMRTEGSVSPDPSLFLQD
ncbi:MAG TPA: ribonuclease H-like domain-containing protein, partial [Chloroflexota bacterium]|nr:ribonuclease H-like domain-containing protein [Chloroflexota bacterium]